MAAHIVFVRFFWDYRDSFPFDRILTVRHEQIGPALETLRKEWLAVPENERELTRCREERRKQREEWDQAALAGPRMTSSVPGVNANRSNEEKDAEPSIEEVFDVAGWGSPTSRPFPHGISQRYPLAICESKDTADAVSQALQFKVNEITRAASERGSTREDDFLTTIKARLLVLAEADLVPGEIFTVRDQIERLGRPKEKTVSAEESILRYYYLPELQRILDLSRPVEPAPKVPVFDENPESSSLTGAERDKAIQSLEPATRKAYLAFCYAESKTGIRLDDREAHVLLQEEGISAGHGDLGELLDYNLPNFETWSRQLREARRALGEQKYKRRGKLRPSRSIVNAGRIENQKGSDQ